MGFFADFMPFYPKPRPKRKRKSPKYDVERALDVELHAHPSLTQHRAANGDLVLCVERQLHPAEGFIARFVKVNRLRRIILDKHGEFLIARALEPGRKLSQVAAEMEREFDLEPEEAKMGIIQMVQELMLRGYVFIVREGSHLPPRPETRDHGPSPGPGQGAVAP